jgi:recombination protein RecT
MNDLMPVIEAQRGDFIKVSCDKNINFDREAGFALQILNANDYLSRIAMTNNQSIINAVQNVAAIGISLNPASKLAYLVPRKGAVCLDISYMGLMHLAQITGSIQWGQAVIVRANDTFTLNGVDKQPTHVFSPFDPIDKRGEIVGCYVVIKTDGGDYLTHPMTAAQINSIRDRSEAFKAYLNKKTPCPWTTDYEEMAKKTVVKQAAKYWPRRDRVDTAIHYLNTDGDEGINFEEEAKPKKRLPALTEEEAKDAYEKWIDEKLDLVDENGQDDNEAIVSAWGKKPSNVRTAIKKHGAALKALADLDEQSKQHINSIK